MQYDHEGLNCPDPDSKTLYSEQNDFLFLEGLNCPDPNPKTQYSVYNDFLILEGLACPDPDPKTLTLPYCFAELSPREEDCRTCTKSRRHLTSTAACAQPCTQTLSFDL